MNRWFRDLSIRYKSTLLVILIVSVVLILVGSAVISNNMQMARSRVVGRYTALADILADNCVIAMTSDQTLSGDVLAGLRVDPTVVYACTYNAEGAIAAEYSEIPDYQPPPVSPNNTHQFTDDGYFEVFRQIHSEEDKVVGTVFLRASTAQLSRNMRYSIMIVLAGLALGLITSLLLSVVLQRNISRPIVRLTEMAAKMASGDLKARVTIESENEFGRLSAALNNVVAQLAESYATLEERVEERTKELARSNEELQRFNRLAVDREMRMIELKREVNQLAKAAGNKPPYDLSFVDNNAENGKSQS